MKQTNLQREYERRFQLQEEYLGPDKPVNRIEPLVSVCVPTYQHAAFIRECLDSILMQETTFPYEVIVGEDESTDGTREICIEYAERHPDRIRLFLRDRRLSHFHEDNRSVRFNGVWTRQSARGKYIALCEGDDYWTDAKKLQKQVDFLDANPNCSLCCHSVKWINATGTAIDQGESCASGSLGIAKIIGGDVVVHTAAMVYRAASVEPYDEERLSLAVGDLPLVMLLSEAGLIHLLDERMGVYRVHEGGIWQMKSSRYKIKKLIPVYQYLLRRHPAYATLIEDRLHDLHCALIHELAGDAEHKEARRTFVESASLLIRDRDEPLSAELLYLAQRTDRETFEWFQWAGKQLARLKRPESMSDRLIASDTGKSTITCEERKMSPDRQTSSVAAPSDSLTRISRTPGVSLLRGATRAARQHVLALWGRRFCMSTGFQTSTATLTSEELLLLEQLIKRSNDIEGPLIEIGTLLGLTTTRMALWKNSAKKVVTVDNYCWNPWNFSSDAHRALTSEMLRYLVETGHVVMEFMDKADFYAKYSGPAPAIVFLDAWHTYEETKKDIEWAQSVKAGIVCGHDYQPDWPGVIRVVDEFGGPKQLAGSLWVL